ncbi:unnamed protein product [Chondrus crispus]|uniref:Uncharacterized protein n=1 Tax=Chondrus crispus TaxID=2769 RepID=R7QPY1_CHOCR|nr:unnamed protein product [Chondrus crispus]CDF39516.1 unnamed protein product [Chondrus crispus]|eukprot:XP_005719427.1 unnamed protein product [Chondrus crispus]
MLLCAGIIAEHGSSAMQLDLTLDIHLRLQGCRHSLTMGKFSAKIDEVNTVVGSPQSYCTVEYPYYVFS